MYHRKSNAARSGYPITAPLPSGTLEIPEFHLILWDRISRREETVTPWCIIFQWPPEKRDGIARGARTSAGNNSGKRRHIERAKESLPEKSTVRHAGHGEKVERARRTGCFKLTLSLFRPKIEKWPFFQSDGIYIHYIDKCNVQNFIINADKIFIIVSL